MEKKLFTKFHRELFCWIDQWHGLTMADIRRIEDEVQIDLQKVVFLILIEIYEMDFILSFFFLNPWIHFVMKK